MKIKKVTDKNININFNNNVAVNKKANIIDSTIQNNTNNNIEKIDLVSNKTEVSKIIVENTVDPIENDGLTKIIIYEDDTREYIYDSSINSENRLKLIEKYENGIIKYKEFNYDTRKRDDKLIKLSYNFDNNGQVTSEKFNYSINSNHETEKINTYENGECILTTLYCKYNSYTDHRTKVVYNHQENTIERYYNSNNTIDGLESVIFHKDLNDNIIEIDKNYNGKDGILKKIFDIFGNVKQINYTNGNIETFDNTTIAPININKKNEFNTKLSEIFQKNIFLYYKVMWNVNDIEKEAMSYYYAYLSNNPDLSVEEKLLQTKQMLKEDKLNNFKLAHSIPILCNGDIQTKISVEPYHGEYLQFFNEYGVKSFAPLQIISLKDEKINCSKMNEEQLQKYIYDTTNYYISVMDNSNKTYSKNFLEHTFGILNSLELILAEDGTLSYMGGTYDSSDNEKPHANLVISMSNLNKNPDMLLDCITHELTHVFDISTNINPEERISQSNEWKEIVRQINKFDTNHNYLGDLNNIPPTESFAEVVRKYYKIPFGEEYSDPNALKNIPINIPGYNNLYDYIKAIVD